MLWINLVIACRTQSEEKEIREVKKRKPEEKKATKIPEGKDDTRKLFPIRRIMLHAMNSHNFTHICSFSMNLLSIGFDFNILP